MEFMETGSVLCRAGSEDDDPRCWNVNVLGLGKKENTLLITSIYCGTFQCVSLAKQWLQTQQFAFYRPCFVSFRFVLFGWRENYEKRKFPVQNCIGNFSFFVNHVSVAPCESVTQTSPVSVFHFLGAFAIFRKATINFVTSGLNPHGKTRLTMEENLMKFDFGVFFLENLSRTFKFH